MAQESLGAFERAGTPQTRLILQRIPSKPFSEVRVAETPAQLGFLDLAKGRQVVP